MKLLVVAVGQRQPVWADEAWADFVKRFPPEMRLELKAVKADRKSTRLNSSHVLRSRMPSSA